MICSIMLSIYFLLTGHEIPYAIKQNHVFPETNGDDQMGSVLQTSNNTSSRCEFVLKHKKSTNKYGQGNYVSVNSIPNMKFVWLMKFICSLYFSIYL